ncbi:gamma-glutamylcyclotransferase [Thiohalorhabdus methylotrophus]|uniref:glutathione-specific gamma-glutamylcyclotransferase n=1 Tax=Thiohalorhabdus methylotrophus TaxID=3242694 RepID=A0ABV4TU35_9GAMM
MASTRDQPMWVFGFGSLVWNPGFPHEEAHLAEVRGFARRFCVYTHDHRGTWEFPGLVLGLIPAEATVCRGVAFRVPRGREAEVQANLDQRELGDSVYQRAWLPVWVAGGEETALTYVANPDHPRCRTDFSTPEAAAIIRRAAGRSGPNTEYVAKTWEGLRTLGIQEPHMDELAAQLGLQAPA